MIQKLKGLFSVKKLGAMSFAFALALVMAVPASFAATPVDPNATDFSSVTLPFSISGMLETAMSFLNLYGQWILLVLAVIFAPTLYGLAMRLISYVSKKFATR